MTQPIQQSAPDLLLAEHAPAGVGRTRWYANLTIEDGGCLKSLTVDVVVAHDMCPGPLYVKQWRGSCFHHAQLVDAAGTVYSHRTMALSSQPPSASSADDAETFVTALTMRLVLLVHGWRERAGFVGAHTRTAETYSLCAEELEAVIRDAGRPDQDSESDE